MLSVKLNVNYEFAFLPFHAARQDSFVSRFITRVSPSARATLLAAMPLLGSTKFRVHHETRTHTHTRTHARTHARTHTCTHAHTRAHTTHI